MGTKGKDKQLSKLLCGQVSPSSSASKVTLLKIITLNTPNLLSPIYVSSTKLAALYLPFDRWVILFPFYRFKE